HLAEGRARWINHPMIGRGTEQGPIFGAIADYCFALGPVTVFRLGRNGASRFTFEAEVVEAPETGFTGCRGWVSSFAADGQARSASDVVAAVLDDGIEHHFVLVAGHWEHVLEEFGEWSNLATLGIAKR